MARKKKLPDWEDDDERELPEWSSATETFPSSPFDPMIHDVSNGTNPYDDGPGEGYAGDNLVPPQETGAFDPSWDVDDKPPDQELGPVDAPGLEPEPMPPASPWENPGELPSSPESTWAGAEVPFSQQRFSAPVLADGGVRRPGEISENPRLPQRSSATNDETLPIEQDAAARGVGDLGTTDSVSDWPEKPTPWSGAEEPLQAPTGGPPVPYEQPAAPPPDPMAAQPPLGPQPAAPRDLGPSMLPHGPTTALNSSSDPAAGALNQQGVNLDDPDPIMAAWAKRRALSAGQPPPPPRQEEQYKPYSSGGHRQSPDDLKRMWRVNTLFGDNGDGDRALQGGLAMNAAVDRADAAGEASNVKRWIADHRLRQGNDPLSEAGQEMLIAARLTSPEGARTATRADQDAARSIGAAGVRDRAIDAGQKKTVVQERGKDARQTREQDFEGRKTGVNDDTRRRGQDINAENVRVQQGGRQAEPEAERATKISAISKAGDVGMREAEDILDSGDYSHLSPSAQARVGRAIASVDSQGGDKKGVARIGASIAAGDARLEDKIAAARRDPKALYKLDAALSESAQTFKPAFEAVARLKKNDTLGLMAHYGTEGWSDLLKKTKAPKGTQEDMAQAYEFIGSWAHGRYGSAFTAPEQKQLENATGIKVGSGVSPANDPAVILRFFNTYKKILQAREQVAMKHFGDSVGGN